jgi:hypothetical protein
MPDEEGTLQLIARHLVLAVQPLEDAVADVDSFEAFMLQLGWGVKSLPQPYMDLAIDVANAAKALENLGPDPAPKEILDVIDKVRTLYVAISTMTTAPAGVDPAEFLAEIADRLFQVLLIDYLGAALPTVYNFLSAIRVIEYQDVDATTSRPAFLLARFRADRLVQMITDPGTIPKVVYGWGTDDLDYDRLATHLLEIFNALGLAAYIGEPAAGLGDGLQESPDTAHGPVDRFLAVPLLMDNIAGVEIELGLMLLPLPAESGKHAGLVVMPLIPSQIGMDFTLYPAFTLKVRAGTDIGSTFGFILRPGEVSVRYPFQPGTPPPTAGFGATLAYSPDSPKAIFGAPKKSRMELTNLWIGLVVESRGSLELRFDIGTDGINFVLSPADLDGFLKKLLGDTEVKLTFPTQIKWSNRTGLAFAGGAGMHLAVNPHLELGPIRLDELDIDLKATAVSGQTPDLKLDVGLVLAAKLGPVSASAEGIGLGLKAEFHPGNAGPLDISVGFKPPKGLGIVVDAGVVTGGGFVLFDPDNGRYAGGIELSIEEITLKAFGLLDTKLPDGKPGFSFLILISAEFTPIQLGFGFTLDGVGGLAGINRTMVLDALQSGFRAHSIDSILFPDIHNAQKIISDLRAIFPPGEGRYVFGPMVEIGWGTPTLVAAQIGIILEVPAPIRLAILGLIVAALPEDDGEDTIVLIHLEVLGVVDFGLKKLAIDASIYDSRVVVFSLSGDMALRLSWGIDATFAFSLGGLHPQYQPPPAFPHLRRLTLSIGDGDNPRMSLTTYMAVTSNTVQFGADLELYAAYGGFSAHGYLAFDALFILSPFSFITEMRAGVDVQYNGVSLCGISLDFILTGPTPWTYSGTVTLHILFFDVSASVSGSFGGGTAKPLPAEPVMTPLLKALNDARSWSAVLPEGGTRGVTFVTPKPDDKTIYVHPLGQLTARQTVVPLATPITKFGSAVPSDGDQFDITDATLTVATVVTPEHITPVSDPFARAQYEEMKDGDKLAAKSYEPFPSGVTLGDPAVESGISSTLDLHYDTQIIDDVFMPSRLGDPYHLTLDLQHALCRQGAGELSPLRSTGNAKYKQPGATSPISVSTPGFVVTNVDDLSVRYDVTGGGATTQRAASVQLQAHVARNPQDAGRLQVMPLHELAA